MYDSRKSPLAESELRFYLSMRSKMYGFAWVFIRLRSKMYDFALVFIGFRSVGKYRIAESELRFYLSMGEQK